MINIYGVKKTKYPNMIDCIYTDVVHGDISTSVDMVSDTRKALVEAILNYDGIIEDYVEPVIVITDEQKIKAIQNAVQSMLDRKAMEKGYDNINSCGKYCGFDNEFREECELFGKWAADCWIKCYSLLDEFKNGSIPEMNLSEVVAVMPACPVPV